jgi:hypothetical protein
MPRCDGGCSDRGRNGEVPHQDQFHHVLHVQAYGDLIEDLLELVGRFGSEYGGTANRAFISVRSNFDALVIV